MKVAFPALKKIYINIYGFFLLFFLGVEVILPTPQNSIRGNTGTDTHALMLLSVSAHTA